MAHFLVHLPLTHKKEKRKGHGWETKKITAMIKCPSSSLCKRLRISKGVESHQIKELIDESKYAMKEPKPIIYLLNNMNLKKKKVQ